MATPVARMLPDLHEMLLASSERPISARAAASFEKLRSADSDAFARDWFRHAMKKQLPRI